MEKHHQARSKSFHSNSIRKLGIACPLSTYHRSSVHLQPPSSLLPAAIHQLHSSLLPSSQVRQLLELAQLASRPHLVRVFIPRTRLHLQKIYVKVCPSANCWKPEMYNPKSTESSGVLTLVQLGPTLFLTLCKVNRWDNSELFRLCLMVDKSVSVSKIPDRDHKHHIHVSPPPSCPRHA